MLAMAATAAAGPSGPAASVATAEPGDPVSSLFYDEFTVLDRVLMDPFGGRAWQAVRADRWLALGPGEIGSFTSFLGRADHGEQH